MTTNNPPIAAWAPSTALAKLASRHNNAPCVLTDGPAQFNDVALVRLSDYERLQAVHEEELFCVRQTRDSHFGEMMRAIEQVDAMKAECEELRQEVEALQGIQPEMPPMPPNGKGLPRYGVRWNGPTQPLSVPKDDGYWTPWHLAQAECEELRKDAERYRWLREQCGSSGILTIAKVGAFELKAWSGDDPDEAIDTAMEGDKP